MTETLLKSSSPSSQVFHSLSLLEKKSILWLANDIASWYLKDSQLEIYRFIRNQHRPLIEAARRWGKTTGILAYVIEELLANPGWVCRWALPEKEQARKILMPEMDKIQADCPRDYQFKYQTTDSVYIHPNGSRIFLYGVNEDQGKSARGSAANLWVLDEYGFWRYPEIKKTVIAPQLRTTRGKMILASTPPEDLGHAWYDEKKDAIREKRFIQKIIFDDEWLKQGDLDQILRDCGGVNSPSFQREYLCKPVADPSRLVIPEYKEELHDYESDIRPRYFDPYTFADLGLNDCTAFLFGFHDFHTKTLFIEEEMIVSGKNTKEITDSALAIEQRLWGKHPTIRRICDNELQQLHDMGSMFNYWMQPTDKDDKLAAVQFLRDRFNSNRIKIHKRCKGLRYQLEVGLWNDTRKSFLRGDKTGHLDAIDALIYGNRHLLTNNNPWPPNEGISHATHHINKDEVIHDKDSSVLLDALKSKF